MTRRGGTTSEGCSQGGDGGTPDKQTKPHQGPHREPPSEPPAGITGTSSLLDPPPPGPAQPSSAEPDHHNPARWGLEPAGLWGLGLVGLSGSRTLRRAALCWMGRGLGRGDRGLPVTPTGGSDGGSRWDTCSGLVCLPGGTPFPPRESPSLLLRRRSGHDSPSDASLLIVRFLRFRPRFRPVFWCAFGALRKRAETCEGFARRLAHPLSRWELSR